MSPPISFLKQLARPVLDAQRHVYGKLNTSSMSFMQRTAARGLWPSIVTADAITTTRTALVIPTVVLLSNGHTVLPAVLVVANAAFDYVDGAVARWEQTDPDRRAQLANAREGGANAASELQISARGQRLRSTWGAYYDAIMDKAFAIPVWMVCFPAAAGDPVLQVALLMHVGIEMTSGYTRTKALFDEPSPASWTSTASSSSSTASSASASTPAPAAGNAGTGTSAVVAGAAGKAKQALSMLGTAFIMVPAVKTIGTVLLVTSVPLALLSLQQKISRVVVYAEIRGEVLTATELDFLERARALGTELVVAHRHNTQIGPGTKHTGDATETSDMRAALAMLGSVDRIVNVPLPDLVNASFLARYGIDRVAVSKHATLETADALCPGLLQTGRVSPV